MALKGIRAPSAELVYFDGRPPETWWEAGAFELVRLRASALGRLAEETGRAAATICEAAQPPASTPLFASHLEAAAAALSRADSLAGLVHTHQALVERTRGVREAAPEVLFSRLASALPRPHDGHVLQLLHQAVARIAAGVRFDPGAAALIAPRALNLVTRLCLQQTELLESVLHAEDDHDQN